MSELFTTYKKEARDEGVVPEAIKEVRKVLAHPDNRLVRPDEMGIEVPERGEVVFIYIPKEEASMPFDLVWVSLGEESPEIDQNRHQVRSRSAQVIFDKGLFRPNDNVIVSHFNPSGDSESSGRYIMKRTKCGTSETDFFIARPYYSNNEGKLTISAEPILPGALVVLDNNLILEDTNPYSGERSLFSNFAVRYPETIPANV